MKKLISLLLASAIVLSLTACGGYNIKVVEPGSSESQTSEPASGSGAVSDAVPADIPEVTDALIEAIVLNFGAEKDSGGAVTPRVVSLYYHDDNLVSDDMAPGDYFAWQFGYVLSQYDFSVDGEFERFSQQYASPYGEDTGRFYPQAEYESNVMRYFDVTAEYLRSDLTYYRPNEQGYWMDGGGGRGDTPVITVAGFQQYDEYLDIGLTLENQSEGKKPKVLTVRLEGDGYKYLSYTNGYLDTASEYSHDDPEFRQKALAIGYSERYLDYLADYFSETGFDTDAMLTGFDAELQAEFDRIASVMDGWLALSSQQLAAEAYRAVASSRDGQKTVYLLYDSEAYYCPGYLIWRNDSTGESRLLSIFSDITAQNANDDLLFVYGHTALMAFDLNTGEKATENVPEFDFGRKTSYQTEHCLVALGWDAEREHYVAGYADWLTQDEANNRWQIKLAVFDRDGRQVNSFPTGVFVPVSVKSFWLYSDKVSFDGYGQVTMRFYDYGAVSCNYLVSGGAAEPLSQTELLSLWDTLSGGWQSENYYASFLLSEGSPVLEMNGASGKVTSVSALTDTIWRVAADIEGTQRVWYVNTATPQDNKISIMPEGGHYEEYSYLGDQASR